MSRQIQSRYYSPETGRFISPDDVDYLDSESLNGLNLYCYCYNDPIDYVDPSGNFAILIGIGFYELFVAFGIIIVGTMTYIALQDALRDISFEIPNERNDNWEIIGDDLSSSRSVVDIPAVTIDDYLVFAEHRTTKNGKGRTKGKHQKGQTRKKTDKFGGEKGDKNRFRLHKRSHLWWLLLLLRKVDENEEYY